MSVGTEGSGPNPRTYSRAEYAALEAENARLKEHVRVTLGMQECLAKERDAALAQLAAIQGGMGEDVAVLATVSMGGVEYGIGGAELGDIDIQPDMKALCALQQSLVTGEDDAYVELIDKAQHQRITAAMAAEVEKWSSIAVMLEQANAGVAQLNGKLRAELAEVKGREAVPVAIANKGECAFWVSWTEAGKPLRGPGIKLYTTPPASPDVEGLVKALELWLADYDEVAANPDFEPHPHVAERVAKSRAALSTWRQAQV